MADMQPPGGGRLADRLADIEAWLDANPPPSCFHRAQPMLRLKLDTPEQHYGTVLEDGEMVWDCPQFACFHSREHWNMIRDAHDREQDDAKRRLTLRADKLKARRPPGRRPP